jgi:hypothetical protein
MLYIVLHSVSACSRHTACIPSRSGLWPGLDLKKEKKKRSRDFGLNPLLHAGYLIYQATQAYIDQSAAKITVCCQTTRQAGVYEKAIPFQMQLQGHHQ